jgi:hypothetical protein
MAELVPGASMALEAPSLCANLKGSMDLHADLAPKAACQITAPAWQRMLEAVHCYGGGIRLVHRWL